MGLQTSRRQVFVMWFSRSVTRKSRRIDAMTTMCRDRTQQGEIRATLPLLHCSYRVDAAGTNSNDPEFLHSESRFVPAASAYQPEPRAGSCQLLWPKEMHTVA